MIAEGLYVLTDEDCDWLLAELDRQLLCSDFPVEATEIE